MTSPTPRDLRGDDLVLSHFSLGREHPIDDRIAAASAAGISGLGFYAGQFAQLEAQGWTIERLRDRLDEASLCIAEIEALSGWASASPSESYLEFEALAWRLVDAFESRYVQAIGPYDGTIDDAAVAFGALCDRAAEHGAVVGLEFLPFTNIVDADDARRIVEQADRPNGGVCVDIWHHARGAADLDMIRAIPGELITGIQMNDGPLAPQLDDYKQDFLRNRLAPGDGEFDAVGFVRVLLDANVDVPWSLEVCNDDVWGRAGGDHVRHVADAMRHVLADARSRP